MSKSKRPSDELHRNPQPPPDWLAFAVHLTRYDIDGVLHYTHPIPNTKGYTAKFFTEHYPGWSLVTFIGVFRAADILLRDGPGSLAGRCHWQLKCLHFDNAEALAVEWDESIVADDGRYYYTGHPDKVAFGNGAFLSEVDPDESDDSLVARIVSQLGG